MDVISYLNRKPNNKLGGVGISDSEFRTIIIDYLLEKNWGSNIPLLQEEKNLMALISILNTYSKQYREEIKAMSGDIETIADVLAIIDKYTAESEEV